MTRTKLRVCPHCILEDITEDGLQGVFRRCFWQFYSIRTCQKHSAPLLHLPAEKHTILNFDFVGQIHKHLDLIRQEAERGLMRKFTPFEVYLQQRFSNPGKILLLDGFRMHIAVKLCETLGATILFEPSRKMRELSEDDLREAGKAGFKAAQDKKTLRKAFTDLWNPGDGQARHKSDLGHLYAWLTREPEHPDNSDLKDLVSQIVFSTYPVRPGSTVFKRPCPRSIKFSLASAVEEYDGLSYQRLSRMAKHAGAAKKRASSNGFILKEPLTRQKINGYLKTADRYLSKANARRLLGLEKWTFDNLVEYGVLNKVESPVDPGRCFQRAELSWLLRDIKYRTRTSPENEQSYFKLDDLVSRGGFPPAEVLYAIRQRKLERAILPEPSQGLKSLQIEEKEFHEFLALKPGSSAVPMDEVATLLKIPKVKISKLVWTGFLEYMDMYM